jgi:Uma2 family endonuclease
VPAQVSLVILQSSVIARTEPRHAACSSEPVARGPEARDLGTGGKLQVMQSQRRVTVRYEVPLTREDWVIPEEPVPESQPHDLAVDLLKAILVGFVARTRTNAQVARNLAIRFTREAPNVGVDPDLCVISPRTPEGDDLQSLRLWEDGHRPPVLAIEVVSESNARKDYTTAPDRYAASGSSELWVFDPKLVGPKTTGGPYRLQVWRQDEDNGFARVYAGDGPAFSRQVGGWLHVVDEGRKLRIADDAEGTSFWMTGEEQERAAKEAALARVAELEEKLLLSSEERHKATRPATE